jgi:hypothetical protein
MQSFIAEDVMMIAAFTLASAEGKTAAKKIYLIAPA